jgi:IMP dehydrogenase/GMP reductase
MLGSELSKTKEAPGWTLSPSGKPESKLYRGQASKSFQESMFGKSSHVEGASKEISWEGDTVESVIQTYENGVQSAISYLGLNDILNISPNTVSMIKITTSGYIEGTPHGI